MVFETGADNEKIDELQRQLDDIIDSQLNSVSGNDAPSIDSTLGQRNDASGDAGGVRSNEPIVHNITENDESGTPTGVFDKINLISSMIIVDHTSTPIDLRFIQGPAKDGAKIKITVKKDKVLVIKSGGNILTSSDITISDEEFFILVKHSEAETGISGGAYKILLTGTGGVAFPIDFPELNTGSPTVSTTIDFADSDRHFRAIILSDDLQVDLTNIPAAGALCTIYFTQDGVGGHVPTIPLLDNPDELSNIDTTPDSTTVFTIQAAFSTVLGFTSGKQIFFGSSSADWANFQAVADIVAKGAGDGMSNIGHLDFIDNLATPVASISLFSDGVDLFANTGGGTVNLSDTGEFFGPWTANHDAGSQSLTNLAAVQIVDIGSIARGSISGDVTLGLVLSTASGGKFSIQDVITPIATFEDSVGLTIEGTHVINMSQNIINTIGQLQFDRAVAFSPSVETGISFDNTLSALNYNVGLTSDIHAFRAAGELLASITRIGSNQGQLSMFAVIATDVLQANEQLFFADSAEDPNVNGEFRRNGVDVKVFTGNTLINLSDVATPSSLIDGNSSLTILDDDAPSKLRLRLDGTPDSNVEWEPDTVQYQANSANWITEYFRNTGAGAASQIIAITFHKGNNAANDTVLNYVTQFSTISDVTAGVESGLWSEAIFTKGSDKTGYTIEGGAGIINTNILHSFFGSAVLKSDQDGDEAVFRLVRNDTSTANNDIVGILNFRAENSIGSEVPYGSFEIDIENNVNIAEIGRATIKLLDDGVTSSMLQLSQGALTVSKTSETGSDVAEFSLLKVDSTSQAADSIGDILFKVLDTPTTTTYARIRSTIIDQTDAGALFIGVRADGINNITAIQIQGSPTVSARTFVEFPARIGSDLAFQIPTGSTSLKIFPALNQLGIVVQDNLSFSVGTLGMLAIPVSATLPTTAAQADGFFGDHKGALGMFDNGSGTLTLFFKQADGNWGSEGGWTRDALT